MRFDLEKMNFDELAIDQDKLAVSASNRDLSWRDFKLEVETQIEKLKSLNLPKGHPVIIYGHKSSHFISSVVACMYLKLIYVPIDNIFPPQRMRKIQSILQSSVVIDTETEEIDFNKKSVSTNYFNEEDPIVYIMFTSGSTGEPKGVQITHKAILSYVQWIKKDFPFTFNDVFFNQIPFSFDLSTYELFCFLDYGASIVSFTREVIATPEIFVARMKKYKCSVWNTTPSFLWLSFMMPNFNSENLPSLVKFFLAGEQMSNKVVKRLFREFESARLYNTYGPTEACNTSTFVEITKELLQKYNHLPVGYPKFSTKINLLDLELEDGKQVGEIELVGENVSIGYFNNPALTKEKFSFKDGDRAYRTGDYGYFEDGMLFFVGRRDDLVKLHGFRVEMKEIERALEDFGASAVVTVPLKRGQEVVKLVSFILCEKEFDKEMARKNLSEKLPYYMVPADIIQLDDFPYNTNHKVDKKALVEIYKGL